MAKSSEELIAEIEALLKELKLSIGLKTIQRSQTMTQKKFSGLTGNIYELSGEGFFDQPKSISEIHKKLKIEGINKPITSLSKPLLLLIGKRILKRDIANGQYVYQLRR